MPKRSTDEVRMLRELLETAEDLKDYFPAFLEPQSIAGTGIAEVLQSLSGLPSGSQLQFFTMRKGSLGGITPLQALEAGDIDAVIKAARAFAEA